MPGESYRRRLRSFLLYLCSVCRTLINSLVCWFLLLELVSLAYVATSCFVPVSSQSLGKCAHHTGWHLIGMFWWYCCEDIGHQRSSVLKLGKIPRTRCCVLRTSLEKPLPEMGTKLPWDHITYSLILSYYQVKLCAFLYIKKTRYLLQIKADRFHAI